MSLYMDDIGGLISMKLSGNDYFQPAKAKKRIPLSWLVAYTGLKWLRLFISQLKKPPFCLSYLLS